MQDSTRCETTTIQLDDCNIFVENAYEEPVLFDYQTIIKKAISELLITLKCPKAEKFEFSMKLSNNEEVHELNKQYRGKDYPTNVLSFEEDLEDDIFSGLEDEDEFTYIGDIIFAIPVLYKQAEEQDKSVQDHFTHLVVHSVLHIFGFDHIDDKEAEVMEALEIKVLKRLEIKNPYLEKPTKG